MVRSLKIKIGSWLPRKNGTILYNGFSGKTFEMFAIHNWTLTESRGMTIVQVDESMEGLLAGVFKKAISKNLEKGMQNWLYLLKKESENSPTLHNSRSLESK